MAQTVTEQKKELHTAEVVRHGEKIVLPEGMSIDIAIEILYRLQQHEEQTVNVTEEIDTFPWDGAYALKMAIEDTWGFSFAKSIPTWFGDILPELKSIPSGPSGQTVMVPWGRLVLPVIDCTLETGIKRKGDRIVLSLTATVRRKFEKDVRALFSKVRQFLRTHSIYKGKPFRIRFRKDNGEDLPVPELKFMNVASSTEESLILPRAVEAAIADNIWTPIERAEDLRELGESLKRTVVLAGRYGTGKTLCADVTANKAQAHSWTFILCERAEEFARSVDFAKQYSPAVIFCEDIDRVAAGDRDVDMDDILNTIDGIEAKSKGNEIMTILTTNAIDSIHGAFIRPGRFDAIIELTLPDADATQRLIRLYAGKSLEDEADIKEAGKVLAGNIPATIAETVKRAILGSVRSAPRGCKQVTITAEAINNAAQAMAVQINLLNRQPEVVLSDREKAATIQAEAINGLVHAVTKNSNGRMRTEAEPDKALPAHAAGVGK